MEVTHQFLHEILAAVDKYGKKMMRIVARADEQIRRGKLRKLGVRFEIRPWRENVEILWERSTPAEPGKGSPDPWTEKGMIERSGEILAVRMTDFGIFAAKEKSEVPYAYAIDARAAEPIVANLRTHGIIVETLSRDTTVDAEQFVIKDSSRADNEFQKHHELTLTGKWKSRQTTLAAGTAIVRTNQPLARLAFYLLEPRSDDGLFEWNFFDAHLEGGVAPVMKVMKPVGLEATVLILSREACPERIRRDGEGISQGPATDTPRALAPGEDF